MKILTIDIETSPNIAHVWGLWQQNVGLSQLMKSSYVLCWAAKWYGDDEVLFAGLFTHSREEMIKQAYDLVSEADVVVTYNGIKFDMPTLNREFVNQGFGPPAPYKNIDLYRVVRTNFNFPSYKLDYVAQTFGVGAKKKHEGHELWVKCLNNDPKAWKDMLEYNCQDVVVTEDLYTKLGAWIKQPNYSLYVGLDDDTLRCPNPICGSTKFHKRGTYTTNVSVFQRYRCAECGRWFRGRKNLKSRKNLGVGL